MNRGTCQGVIACVILLWLAIAPWSAAWSESRDDLRLADIRYALNELFFELQGLRLEMLQSGLHLQPISDENAGIMQRLDDIESRLRESIDQIEQIEFRVGIVAAEGIATIRNLRSRISALESPGGSGSDPVDGRVEMETASGPVRIETGSGVENSFDADVMEARQFSESISRYTRNDYAGTIVGLNTFLQEFPDTDFRSQALFHLGASHAALGNRSRARELFLDSIIEDTGEDLTPLAMLLIGQSLISDDLVEQACQVLDTITRNYPGTGNALQARTLMQRVSCGG